MTRHSLTSALPARGAARILFRATTATATTATAVAAVTMLLTAAPVSSQAPAPTRVMVRVTSHDAKIIGSGVGGARITIRDQRTGSVLAEGIQEGSTGDTGLIMGSRDRGASVYDTEGAAGFMAELPLSEPTWVVVSAEGPLGTPDALRHASTTTLLIPGRDVVGDGIVLELRGFTVELREPAAGSTLPAGEPVDVLARVTMLCGCPTSAGGLWDSDGYEIVARVHRDGRLVSETPLAFTGETSMHGAALPAMDAGEVTIEVLSIDEARGNFGLVRRTFSVEN
jgi:hypothetical protein